MASSITYTPPASLIPFFTSEKFVSLAVGPVGCVDGATEFLTPIGWKRIDEYAEGDKVAQWNKETEQAEFVDPIEYIKLPCKEFFHFSHPRGLDQVLSAEHRMLLWDRRGKRYQELLAGEVAQRLKTGHSLHSWAIPCTFKAPDRVGMSFSDDEIRLGVAICADGWIPKNRPGVNIEVKKERKKQQVRELLGRLGIHFSEPQTSQPGFTRFYFRSPIQDKVFGPRWWSANQHQLEVIADELTKWDGGSTSAGGGIFRTRVKENADFAQYCFAATGKKATSTFECGLTYHVVTPKKPVNYVGLPAHCAESDAGCRVIPSEDGFKYCFSVPSTYLILRRNGRIAITGNSTKTTAAIMKIAYHAKRMAPCKDGIRRSRAVFVRNTREQLRDTSIPDFLSWFPDGVAGTYAKTDNEFLLKFDDVECKVMFRGLDDARDVRRLLSLQVSFAILDEFREINPEIFKAIQGRLGRYPNKMMVPPRPEWGKDDNGVEIGGCVTDDGKSNAHLWGATNPPDMETFWEEFLTNPPDNCHITIQPSGLSPKADWIEFLPANYYDNLAEGKDQDWIDVYIHAKFGKSLAGQPVFRSFARDLHVSKDPLRYIKSVNQPIIIGMDAALHPAAIFGQVDYKGRLLVLDEAYAVGMGAANFIREKVKPILASRFPGQPVIVVIDPAANTRSQTDEKTVLDIIRSEGLPVRMASTNSIQARISAVDANLTRVVDGEPWMLIDGSRCPNLIAAMAGKYRYRRKTDGNTEDKPDKTHPWSDLCDALQYLCLHTDTSGVYNQLNNDKAVPVQRVAYRYL